MDRILEFSKQKSTIGRPRKNAGGVNALLEEIQGGDLKASLRFKMHVISAVEGGRMVYEMRAAAGLTQQQLASLIGISQQRISKIEAGNTKSGPSLPVLFEVADACGLKFCLSWSEDKPSKDGSVEVLSKHRISDKKQRFG